MNEIAKSWYVACRRHAMATDSLESFQQAVSRVTDLHGGDPTTVEYFRPMFQSEPTMIEFSAGGLYGGICYHEGSGWSVNT